MPILSELLAIGAVSLAGLAALALGVRLVARRSQRLHEDELLAKAPCVHRFIRVRWKVGADGKPCDPQPICGDCGKPVPGVAVKEGR